MIDPVFVDTNIWVYSLTLSDDRRHELARRWLAMLQSRPRINGQVVREVGRILNVKAKVGEAEIRQAIGQLYVACHVVPDSLEVYLLASRLRDVHAFNYWDSLIVAAALEAGCATLYTEDMQHGQVIDGRLTIINPFRDG